MSFTGLEDQEISLQEASDLTANYRNAQTAPGYVKGAYYSQKGLHAVLSQTGCVGVRIYYGLSDSGVPQLVIVGVDSDEEDMTSGVILDRGGLCPPNCGSSNVLNSSNALTS